jgi:hypothetical protein
MLNGRNPDLVGGASCASVERSGEVPGGGYQSHGGTTANQPGVPPLYFGLRAGLRAVRRITGVTCQRVRFDHTALADYFLGPNEESPRIREPWAFLFEQYAESQRATRKSL